MGRDPFLLPVVFDYGATLLWGITGALIAARQGFDVVGVFFIALASATGGGLLRDGIFLQDGPPLLVRSPVYLLLVLIATIVVALVGKRVQQLRFFDALVLLVDGLGLGAYAVVGMNRASALGLSILGVVLVGVVNAVGGGVLRAILVGQVPHLFKPGTLEAVAALFGCGVFLGLTRTAAVGQTTAAWITIGLVFLIRVLSVRYGFATRALRDFADAGSV